MRWILAYTKENTLNKNHLIEVEVTDGIVNIILMILDKAVQKRLAKMK
jgi:hypothetical protein